MVSKDIYKKGVEIMKRNKIIGNIQFCGMKKIEKATKSWFED